MKRDRGQMTVRIVPLRSDEAGDARVAGTAAERLVLVRELSRRAWALTKRPVPTYRRSEISVKVIALSDQ